MRVVPSICTFCGVGCGIGQRVQRFWFHKFADAFTASAGRYGCVGCGRCDRVCPGGIGVHGVMQRVGRP